MNRLGKTDQIYMILVNKIPGIQERYKRKRNSTKGIGRVGAWAYLLWLNLAYHVFRYKRVGTPEKYPYYENKHLYSKGSESSLSKREPPEELAKRLARYDMVSFDVFDTLLLRPFDKPADLFYLLGDELEYMDFKRIRMEAEWKAREKKYKETGSHEVTLEEIYDLLAEETGIDKKQVMRREVELEKTYCFANPYMKKVTEELKKRKKRLLIISDMYLHTEQIRELLKGCGYEEFDAYYVSCDRGKSKSKGDLYREVKEQEEARYEEKGKNGQKKELRLVHVGDNYVADIENARKQDFDTIHYVNVNAAGEQYRAEDMSAITGSLYRGIVNTHIHNGLKEYTREYEYGFIYGGLFVTGYCQFIHNYAAVHGADRILFLARDGDILRKVYHRLYPEEEEKTRYVYWSRLAAAKLAAGYFKYDYFRRFLYHRVNQGYTLEKILSSMELEDMLEEMCQETGLPAQERLTEKNVEKIKAFFLESWNQVLAHYEGQTEAGGRYFREVLGDSKKAVAVDIGWAGSGAIALDYMVNKVWKLDCSVTGIIAGTNTCHNAEPDTSETFLQGGKLVSYLYSQRENRDLWKLHDPGKNHNLYWEILLEAPHGSLKGFYLDEDGKWECRFKEEKADRRKVEEIQRGILEFAGQYKQYMEKSELFGYISGRDAYAPMILAERENNKEFIESICGLMDEVNIG